MYKYRAKLGDAIDPGGAGTDYGLLTDYPVNDATYSSPLTFATVSPGLPADYGIAYDAAGNSIGSAVPGGATAITGYLPLLLAGVGLLVFVLAVKR